MAACVMMFTDSPDNSGDSALLQENDPVQTGFIAGGSVRQPSGVAWNDTSSGESYGDGQRYAHEETYFMAKVQGHRSKLNGAG